MNDINIGFVSNNNDIIIQIQLAHLCQGRYITCHVTMEATSKERNSADIQATAHLHKDVACQQLADNAICRGADT